MDLSGGQPTFAGLGLFYNMLSVTNVRQTHLPYNIKIKRVALIIVPYSAAILVQVATGGGGCIGATTRLRGHQPDRGFKKSRKMLQITTS